MDFGGRVWTEHAAISSVVPTNVNYQISQIFWSQSCTEDGGASVEHFAWTDEEERENGKAVKLLLSISPVLPYANTVTV